jgi:hypothetical protein
LIPSCGTETFGGEPDDRDPCACPEEDATCACLSRGSDLLLLFADDSQPLLRFAGGSHPLLRLAGRNRECLVRNSSVLRRLIPSVGTAVQASFTAVGNASIRSSIASSSSCSGNSIQSAVLPGEELHHRSSPRRIVLLRQESLPERRSLGLRPEEPKELLPETWREARDHLVQLVRATLPDLGVVALEPLQEQDGVVARSCRKLRLLFHFFSRLFNGGWAWVGLGLVDPLGALRSPSPSDASSPEALPASFPAQTSPCLTAVSASYVVLSSDYSFPDPYLIQTINSRLLLLTICTLTRFTICHPGHGTKFCDEPSG